MSGVWQSDGSVRWARGLASLWVFNACRSESLRIDPHNAERGSWGVVDVVLSDMTDMNDLTELAFTSLKETGAQRGIECLISRVLT